MFYSLDYITFGHFLGEFFDANALRNEEVLMPSNLPTLPRQGLDSLIKNAWAEIGAQFKIHTQFALANVRKPLLFVHSSPGCGKVRPFYQIINNKTGCKLKIYVRFHFL